MATLNKKLRDVQQDREGAIFEQVFIEYHLENGLSHFESLTA